MIICAITFIVFVFCFLYYYEADVLTIAQHELSKGQTHYNRTVGAFLITIVLGLFSWGMFRLTKLRKRTHALVYFPALLTLAIISDVSQKVNEVFCFGAWTIIYPLLLFLFENCNDVIEVSFVEFIIIFCSGFDFDFALLF